ncbi:DUF6262 family protein (plasmid) [Arthrobacter sp. UC242_113]|uniref:DUF6262 family protein n=1 Tax=Arthrobacter sp. UC242_113 TaxID=3374550 RepID=UPI003757AFC1
MRTDNTHHLLTAARRRSETARQRAEQALRKLDQTTQAATVSELARTAGVSRSWLYTQPDLLEQLRVRNLPPKTTPTGKSLRVSEASLKARLQLAHQRIQRLSEENRQLRDRLARAHGELRQTRL